MQRTQERWGLRWFGWGAVLACALLASCQQKQAPEGPPDTLQLALNSPRSLDPNTASESEGGTIIKNCFEGLYVVGPSGNEHIPGVAVNHTVSPDGKTWTFKLRPEARWSDAKPVTAGDFEFSWKRLLDPQTGAETANIMAIIEGASEFNRCESDAQAQNISPASLCEERKAAVGVRALDDYTLEVKLRAPYPLFGDLTSFYAFMPVPKHVVTREIDGASLTHNSRWTTPEYWVSNGPYKLVANEDRVQIVLEKNPHYWARDAVDIDRVVVRIMEDARSIYSAFSAGQIDYIEDDILSGELRKRWMTGSPQLKVFPRLGVYMIVLNHRMPPFDDVRVRQAFNLAIDKAEIARNVVGGGEAPATHIVPQLLSELTPYKSPQGDSYDPAKARALLLDAGYPDPTSLGVIRYSYNTSDNNKKVAEAVAQMWERNLGVEVELYNMEWKIYLDELKSGRLMVGRYGWIADYVDPMTFLDLFESKNVNNASGWNDPVYDGLIQAARLEPDAAARYALLAQAEARWVAAMPIIPVYFYSQKMLIQGRLEGIEPQLLGDHLFRYMRLKPQ